MLIIDGYFIKKYQHRLDSHVSITERDYNYLHDRYKDKKPTEIFLTYKDHNTVVIIDDIVTFNLSIEYSIYYIKLQYKQRKMHLNAKEFLRNYYIKTILE